MLSLVVELTRKLGFTKGPHVIFAELNRPSADGQSTAYALI